ncbi:MAG: hypothetical protein ACI9XC_000867 [Gammaproteobacteria bacterium]|jgi:hypothetical protein
MTIAILANVHFEREQTAIYIDLVVFIPKTEITIYNKRDLTS